MSDQTTLSQNSKVSSDHLERQSSKTNKLPLIAKQQSIQNNQYQDSDKKVNPETSSGNLNGSNSSSEHLSSTNNNKSCSSASGVELPQYENNCNMNNQSHNYIHGSLDQKRGQLSHQYNRGIQNCKIHPSKQVTKICLHPGCSLTREICNECEQQLPHSSHQQSIVDAKKFFVDVELNLKEFCINSPLMNAADMFEQGKQFILRHFQSMNNMLVERAPEIVKILALLESTENAKRIPLKTFELERYIRDIMGIFRFDKSGKLEYHLQQQLHDQDIVKEEIRGVLFMLRDLENVVRYLHDDFARALKFGDYNPQKERNNNYQNIMHYNSQYQSSSRSNQTHHQIHPSHHNGIDEGSYMKSDNEQGSLINNYNPNQFKDEYLTEQSQLKNKLPQNLETQIQKKISNKFKENSPSNSKSNMLNWGQQFHPNTYNNNNMDIEGGSNPNIKSKVNENTSSQNAVEGNNELLSSIQMITNADVLNDPAFLKRPRGRPKGSKCKKKGKYKGKYTDDEKLQILQEAVKIKSIQVIAEKYRIQKSLIRYWARSLKYELDPQTITSRRPYRTFTKEQKKIIVQDAIKRRDIVIVAQEYDMNAQVLKRWILKSAQGSLHSSEIRQMMNAVPNLNEDDDEEENSQSQDDSDINSDQDEEDDDDEMDDEDIDQIDEELYGIRNSDKNTINQLHSHLDNKAQSSKLKQSTKVKVEDNTNNHSSSLNQLQNEDFLKMEQSLKEQEDSLNDIIVKDEENNKQETHPNKTQMQNQEKRLNENNKLLSDEEDNESEEDDSDDDSDEEEDDASSQIQDQVQKKKKPNEDQNENLENQNPNKQIDKKQQLSNIQNNITTIQNQASNKAQNVSDILNFDVLKTVNLKNLDLSTNTEEQSERLKMMQKQIEEELQKMKQQQQEHKLKKISK